MFQEIDPTTTSQSKVSICVDGEHIDVLHGISLAAALLQKGDYPTRTSPVSTNSLREPFCMMGVCFECLVEIDGAPNQQSCLVTVREGMVIKSQVGAADIIRASGEQND